eukprot:3995517-Alexandrium_andersonii.AAC.1
MCIRDSAGTKDSEPISFSGTLREKLREAQEQHEPYHALMQQQRGVKGGLSLIHISEPTRLALI